jgi:hypothetical protein
MIYLRSLVGKTVVASAVTTSYASRNPAKEYYLHLNVDTPTEVFLNSESVNGALLADGYAMLDEGELSLLSVQELDKFRSAEMLARRGLKGIWVEATDVYISEKARMLQERELSLKQSQGAGLLLKVQGAFVLSVLWLAYLLRRNPNASVAALVLLLIPVGLLMPAYVRFSVSPRSNPYAANSLLIALALLCVSVWVFVWLVRRGPAEQWGAVGMGMKRTWPLVIFFAGLAINIVIFAILYQSVDHLGRASALHESISIALGLSALPPLSGTTGALIQKIVLLIWTGFCAATFSPQSSIRSRSIGWNVLVAIASLSIVVIAVVSTFALCFSASFEASRITDAVDMRQCLTLAFATLFRQSYLGPSVHTTGIWILQVIEASLGLFLALVGFRTIYGMASPAARTATASPTD